MRQRIPILLYHSVAETVAPRYSRWAVKPTAFAAQMAHLRRAGYQALTVTQLAQILTQMPTALPTKPVVITFDDGLADFYTDALPVLQQYELPATLYITTGYVEAQSRWLADLGEGHRAMMSWAQIAELPGYGIECGAHTHTHPQLDTLPRAQARHEITFSKRLLEEKLGRTVDSFAYPHGYHDRTVQQMVREAAFSSASAVKHAMSCTCDDRFALARIIIAGDTSIQHFARMVGGQGIAMSPKCERLETKLWRLFRQWQAYSRLRPTPSFANPLGSHAP